MNMRDDQHQFLMIHGQLPVRLTAEQTGWLLNCQSHNIPVLVAARLLKPLGNPPANGFKFFATAEILELAKDKGWLVKVSNAITQHWRSKNASRRDSEPRFGSSGGNVIGEGNGGVGCDR